MNEGVQSQPDFGMLIKRAGDDYVCYIPELKLIARAPSADEAFQEAMRQKDDLLKLYEDTGLENEIPLPASTMGTPVAAVQAGAGQPIQLVAPTKSRVPLLITVALLVIIFILGPFWFLRDTMHVFQHRMKYFGEYLARPTMLYEPAARVLHDVALCASMITPDKKEQIREDLRTLVMALKPFTDELHPLFVGPAQAPAQPPASKGPIKRPPEAKRR